MWIEYFLKNMSSDHRDRKVTVTCGGCYHDPPLQNSSNFWLVEASKLTRFSSPLAVCPPLQRVYICSMTVSYSHTLLKKQVGEGGHTQSRKSSFYNKITN